ncbi:ribosome biogenesis regulatory protein-domain-containing protein [Lophiotrema nucula]|uniref:Ribosome biogenesis regulatory protein n=1 Tax=Lophiotrema nucula TaxID=690887 RepID=A0A6A5YZD3_9PLEO|nr:ribosome biogenesis regulatory protein-domain-containing protein [Lophiotrema nucula]
MADTEMTDGVPLNGPSPTDSTLASRIKDGAMDVSSTIDTASGSRLPVTVEKPNPYEFDLGNLLAIDTNIVPRDPSEEQLSAIARDAAQVLINQLLTTCKVTSNADGVTLKLPLPTTALPREKPIPTPKPPTKWELFAAKKGIKDKKREGKMVFDEEKQDWVPKWGYKGKNKEGEDDWLVEVDDKKEKETGEAGDKRAENRQARKDRVKRNERKQRANDRNARKNG